MIDICKTPFDINRYDKLYTADFETSTPAWNVDKARVWLWDICDEKHNHINGIDILSFMSKISELDSAIIGFRNLSFDGFYILNFLLENGFEFEEELKGNPFTFTSLITDTGQHYFYKILFGNGSVVTIFDTFKHCHQSIADTVKAYKLPIMKGEIDYNEYREIGHNPTEEELTYIHNDTEIDMRALQLDIEQGLSNITQTGNCKKLLHKTLKDYDVLFPQLDKQTDLFCRQAYRGGYTYLNKRYFNKDIKHAISLDINSMYPAQMLHMKMPWGEPEFGDGEYSPNKVPPNYDIYIQHIECGFKLKEGCVPTVSKRAFKVSSIDNYIEDSEGDVCELYLSNPDLELFFQNYSVYSLKYIDFCAFRSIKGNEITAEDIRKEGKLNAIKKDGYGSIFYDYILPLRITKETSEGAVRDNAKRMQNIVYGAFASSPKGGLYAPYLDEDLLRFKRYEGKERKLMYIPVSVFITAWSRYFLINSIKKVYDRFIYCDTDSLYLEGDEIPDLPIHKTIYGFFKIEHRILKARFLGAKRYIYFGKDNKSSKIHKYVVCCGATTSIKKQITFANFRPNAVFSGKLMNKTVKGGKHLVESTYKLNI